jgi:hypothetical protein
MRFGPKPWVLSRPNRFAPLVGLVAPLSGGGQSKARVSPPVFLIDGGRIFRAVTIYGRDGVET